MKKRILALLLVLVLAVSLVPAVSAAQVLETGSAGEKITWTMYDDGRLVFSGTGATVDNDSYTVKDWYRYMGDIKHVIFTEGITYIGDYLFYNSRSAVYDSIEVLSLPGTLKKIGTYAFTGLDGLHTVEVADLNAWCNVEFEDSGANPLDNQVALSVNGSTVETLVIPRSVTKLKDYAFMGCSSIRSVIVHENVEEIGSFAFNTCSNLKSVYFQGDAPTFGEHIFTLSNVTCYYPADKSGWEKAITGDWGENVTWKVFEPLPFADVSLGAFYYDPVSWAVEKKITTGLNATTFGPNTACNRAQVVTFLWRAAGSPEPAAAENPFVDVQSGSYYEKAVLWAVEKGITTGTDDTHFSPDAPCNRATVVTFLYRALESPVVEADGNPFTDVPAGEWYTAPVLWAVEQGITNGLSADTFGVNTPCNRAQIVTFLYRTYVN